MAGRKRFLAMNPPCHNLNALRGKLSKVTTVDGIVQVTFLGVTDDANVFDTLSGALLDLRLELEVVPDLDVKIRRR